MQPIIRTRVTVLWLVLVILTLCSVELLQAVGGPWGRRPYYGVLFLITYMKVRIVGLDYMELRFAPRALRFAFEAWLVIVMVTIVMLMSDTP